MNQGDWLQFARDRRRTGETLTETSRRLLVEQEMLEHVGNRSACARDVGCSKSTFHSMVVGFPHVYRRWRLRLRSEWVDQQLGVEP